MKRESYIRLVFMICAAVLPAVTGSLFAAGTGELDHASGWYSAGTNFTVVAAPHEYSVFDRWDGSTNGATIQTNTIEFSVNSAMAITAVFRPKLTAAGDVPYQWLADVLGITDGFETAVTNDPDGDTFTTAQEYWAGTDPTTNASYLNISQVEMTATNFRLIWAHSKIGAKAPEIVIQSRASLSAGDWTNAAVHVATNGPNFWNAPGQQAAFYRLAVTNMP